ncbi:hypothetical protein L0152_26455 [bacterium]|nr:hypothetical protein [bacterium]
MKPKNRFDRRAADAENKLDKLAAESVSHFAKHSEFQIPFSMDEDLLQEASLKILRKIGRYENTKLNPGLLIIVGSRATRDATYWVNDCTVHLPRSAFVKDENGECEADKWKKHEFSDEALKDFGRNRFSRSEAQEQCEYDETLEWLYVDLCRDDIDRRMVYYLGIEELSLDATAERLDISRRQVTNRLIDLRERRRAWEWK